MTEFVDVVIVGAGISGISAAWHLQDRCPSKSYLVLESRDEPRRHLGPVQVPGYPVRLRHVHARIPVQAVGVGAGDRRRAVDPELSEGSGRRERHRQAHALRPEGDRRRLVRRGQPLDADASNRDGEQSRDRLLVPVRRPPATTTTTRATRPSSPARKTSAAPSSTRSTGRRTSTTRARRSSSSAAAPPP